jgi:hypothetical protein
VSIKCREPGIPEKRILFNLLVKIRKNKGPDTCDAATLATRKKETLLLG